MNQPAGATFFGQPRGLATLFFTEMWERMSYYGMRALLLLYMTAQLSEGGMGLSEKTGGALYGLYTMTVYLMSLMGGYIADNYLGQRKSVWYGGIMIAAGHFSMAIPSTTTFFIGLVLIVIGTGFLKPNVSTIVGELYPEGGARRDAGFSIFYTGINLGAFLGPIVCGFLGEKVNWHWGFGAAGVGMLLGLIQFKMTEKYLGEAGIEPKAKMDKVQHASSKGLAAIFGAILVASAIAMQVTGFANFTEISGLAEGIGYVIVELVVLYFAYLVISPSFEWREKKRIMLIFILLIGCALFWSGFEQAGTSLNLFAKYLTDRHVMGWESPASWLQSVNPIFIIVLSPVFGYIWIKLAQKSLTPSSPLKFAFGLIFLALGFWVMAKAGQYAIESKVAPTWLIITYFLHTVGELCLSPVGLSTITKLAPPRIVGQMMGSWFTATAIGNLIAGLASGNFNFSAFTNAEKAHDALGSAAAVTPNLLEKIDPIKDKLDPSLLASQDLEGLRSATQRLMDTAMKDILPQIPANFFQTFLITIVVGAIFLVTARWAAKLAPDVE
ncbi:MAG: peptide MFS transporter [Acidobacteria bacterium]|nr:peptide MFS transporter [Acidobacteriota bacterium]MCB9396542.1 peptide MFS transporter [Acidobacteriota bacterium]